MTHDQVLSIGLTGGIGSGKSAVSSAYADLGAIIIDADRIAREVVEPGTPGLGAVIEAFGKQLLTAEGALDRAALAEIVFGDQAALATLNSIVHPLVYQRREELFAAARPGDVVINDIPLLAEGSSAPTFHLVLVVHAPAEVRLERLTGQRGVSEDDAKARMANQATDAQRARIADVILDNSGSLAALHAQVERVWHERLRPFADNLVAARPADPAPQALPTDRDRIVARLERATGGSAHPGDGAEIRLTVDDPSTAHGALRSAGWFATPAANDGSALRSADPHVGHVLDVVRNADR